MTIDEVIAKLHEMNISSADYDGKSADVKNQVRMFVAACVKEFEMIKTGNKFSNNLMKSMIDSLNWNSELFSLIVSFKKEHPEHFES
ncbi:MAG: hypothetical protein ACLGG0_08675 [Bacteriovoracia bacterium]